MFLALRDNAIAQVDVAANLIDAHEQFASDKPPALEKAIKQYAVAACVMRLYAVYEHFAETLVADYLDALPDLLAFDVQPACLRNEYRIGISQILGKIDSGRYSHLGHEDIIRRYHAAITNESAYRFVTEALTRHEQNLRLPVLETMSKRLDLMDLRIWLSACKEIRELYVEEDAIANQLESELHEFIQIRNDAAHGVMESLEGKTLLERHCQVIRALVIGLSEYFHRHLLERQEAAGKVIRLGIVTEVFMRAGALICLLDAGREVRVGSAVHFMRTGYCRSDKVESIHLNDVPAHSAVAGAAALEVGIRCAALPPAGCKVYAAVDTPMSESVPPGEVVSEELPGDAL